MKFGPKTEDVLYHYTSQNNLHNIVETKSLWVSHAYYMNDANEIKLAARLLQKLVEKRKQNEEGYLSDFLGELQTWINQLIGIPHYIFVFSISGKGNLLSQWRGYTSHGSGVSIGFNKVDLERLAKLNDFILVKCVYKLKEQTKILNEVLESIITTFESERSIIDTKGRPENQKYLMYFYNFIEILLKTFCRIKDSTFEEECEWRLVSRYFKYYTDPKIIFRSGKTTLIPYIVLKLDNVRKDGLLFEQVYVGPSPNFDLSMPAVGNYLSNRKACNMTINSQSPFREV